MKDILRRWRDALALYFGFDVEADEPADEYWPESMLWTVQWTDDVENNAEIIDWEGNRAGDMFVNLPKATDEEFVAWVGEQMLRALAEVNGASKADLQRSLVLAGRLLSDKAVRVVAS